MLVAKEGGLGAQDGGTPARSLWLDVGAPDLSIDVLGQARTSVAAVEVHEVVFHRESRSDRPTPIALFDLSLTGRGGDPVGHFPDVGRQPQRPLGELLFLPPRTRFRSHWRRGRQRTLWVVPSDTAAWLNREWPAEVLDHALDIRSIELRQAMLRLARELEHPGFAAALMIEALCVEVLVLVQRHLWAPTGPGEVLAGPGHAALGRAELRIVEDLIDAAGPSPSLAELARACGVSERHFSRLFRLATGQSPARFASDRRLDRARDRLAASRASIKQIAWEAGFESAAAFSSAFRRKSGQSPKAFRQAFRA